MDDKKRKAKKTRWLGVWLFLVCAMFSAACSKSVIGSYGGTAVHTASVQPRQAVQQQAAPKTLQVSSSSIQAGRSVQSAQAAQAARVGQAVRKQSSLPVLQASGKPTNQAIRQVARPQGGSKQAAVKQQPAKTTRTVQASSGKQVSRGKATAVRGDTVCRTVRGQVGTRYKYGGASPKTGFDCSGLLAWAYNQHGVSIPRTAKAQSGAGKSVQRNKLAPGDIVVFKIKSGYHTGMYTGNNRFIHSPRTGSTVREDQLDNDYWKKAYIGARRVI